MKFKYYLRGAGVGVIISTVILSIAFLFQDNMSDAEIIQRAMELGMVMEENSQGTLKDVPRKQETKVDIDADDPSKADDTSSADDANNADDTTAAINDHTSTDPGTSDDPSVTDPEGKTDDPAGKGPDTGSDKNDTTSSDPVSKSTPENDPEPAAPSADGKVTITIVGGDVSRMVAQKVCDAGLVDDVDEFNSYLGAHGYDNLLQPGTYEIAKGSSYKQIARILTAR